MELDAGREVQLISTGTNLLQYGVWPYQFVIQFSSGLGSLDIFPAQLYPIPHFQYRVRTISPISLLCMSCLCIRDLSPQFCMKVVQSYNIL
jgi:hypothetical protein